MTPERFQTIVDAYGADPRRWPQEERAAAEAWAELHRSEADAALAESASIDAWLASHTIAPPPRALVERIVATAPVSGPFGQGGRLWWQGAAFAGIGLAGGLAGAFAVSFFVLTSTPPSVRDASYVTSSFGGSTADWSGE
jgi:hypothetical protein